MTDLLNPYWHGMLCLDNAHEVAARMRQVLDGHHFTLVTANSYSETSDRYTAVEVKPSQWLTSPVEAKLNDWAHVGWSSPAYSMGVMTRAKTPSQARERRPHDYVHLTFEPSRVEIDHYAPAGYRLLWVLAVEHHDPEYGPDLRGGDE